MRGSVVGIVLVACALGACGDDDAGRGSASSRGAATEPSAPPTDPTVDSTAVTTAPPTSTSTSTSTTASSTTTTSTSTTTSTTRSTTTVPVVVTTTPPPDGGDRLLAALPLAIGDSGPAVVDLQESLAGAGISVGPSYADGQFGPDTARAVSMIPPDSIGDLDPDPGAAGVMTVDLLGVLRERIEADVVNLDGGICAAPERLVTATQGDAIDGVFRLDDIRCAYGWVQATVTEYGFADRSQLYYLAGIGAPEFIGGAYAENGCALYGVPVEAWEFFGCG